MGFLRSAKKTIEPAAAAAVAPRHVAIIMDGNGRWAKNRGLGRTAGHRKGADALRALLEGCRNTGLHYLTIYAFSSENWKRPESEISELMELLRFYLRREVSALHENGIRFKVIGDRTKLEPDIQNDIEQAEALTAGNTQFQLNVALSYGGRQEIMRAAKRLLHDVAEGKISADAMDEHALAERLDTAGLPDPDLLIRTGGDQRISNFLLWQSAYTEFYFTPVLWPDFTIEHFHEALKEYAQRERRYGAAGE